MTPSLLRHALPGLSIRARCIEATVVRTQAKPAVVRRPIHGLRFVSNFRDEPVAVFFGTRGIGPRAALLSVKP